MHSFWTGRTILAGALFGLIAVATPVAGQSSDRESLAARIERSILDSNLVSPITGARVPIDAVTLTRNAFTNPTDQIRTRLRQALVTSGVSPTVLEHLLTSLPPLATEPIALHVELAEEAFNEFVNLASPGFLHDPPAEFLALHAILLHASTAV